MTILETGLPIYAPCGGGGRCGKCRVIATGALSEPDAVERALLGVDELARGVRLACRARALGEVQIRIPGEAAVYYITEYDVVEADTGKHPGEHSPVPGAAHEASLGIAVDIGTTTVAASAVSLVPGASPGEEVGRRVAEASAPNPQAVWGADVMSRISAVADGRVSADEMRRLVRGCVDELRRRLGVMPDAPAVIVGNTVMLSFWAGADVTWIGRAPFGASGEGTPEGRCGTQAVCEGELFGCEVDGAYLPRCVSAFVGADAVGSYLLAGDAGDTHDRVIVDIGTNGEIISRLGGKIYAASAAAGPALEGAGISCGMTATAGAICGVRIRSGRLECDVIGGGKARGICGSGLIDAVACLLRLGVIDKSGYMAQPYELADGVVLTPEDVRSLQLAKGAIRAALDMILEGHGGVPRLYLSGAFGSGVSVESCARIGLIPPALAENVVMLGNGALRAAEMMLIDPELRDRTRVIAESAEVVELSGSAEFEKRFIDALSF